MGTRGTGLELATRGSELARRQAGTVTQRLAERRIGADLVEVETTGDQPGTTGARVHSLDRRVLAGELDGAVHSMKDMPTEQPDELVVAAVLERGSAADVLVTPGGTPLDGLPAGAVVGTSSLRRQAQLLARRPDLDIVGLRGDVDTRVERLLAPTLQREHRRRLEAAGEFEGAEADDTGDSGGDTDTDGREYEQAPEEWFDSLTEIERRALGREVDTEYDAICLAVAGLERSGLERGLATERLDPQLFVPAPAQGAIAVTAVDGETTDRIHDAIDHPPSRVAVTVERTVLAELGGGCVAPVGVHARLQGSVVTTTARVLSRDGTEEHSATRELPVERHAEAAAAFGADLAADGAKKLVEQAKRTEPDDTKRGGQGG
jgi:hydroxymethylbilane synthase (EC 2.5.1.61)